MSVRYHKFGISAISDSPDVTKDSITGSWHLTGSMGDYSFKPATEKG